MDKSKKQVIILAKDTVCMFLNNDRIYEIVEQILQKAEYKDSEGIEMIDMPTGLADLKYTIETTNEICKDYSNPVIVVRLLNM